MENDSNRLNDSVPDTDHDIPKTPSPPEKKRKFHKFLMKKKSAAAAAAATGVGGSYSDAEVSDLSARNRSEQLAHVYTFDDSNDDIAIQHNIPETQLTPTNSSGLTDNDIINIQNESNTSLVDDLQSQSVIMGHSNVNYMINNDDDVDTNIVLSGMILNDDVPDVNLIMPDDGDGDDINNQQLNQSVMDHDGEMDDDQLIEQPALNLTISKPKSLNTQIQNRTVNTKPHTQTTNDNHKDSFNESSQSMPYDLTKFKHYKAGTTVRQPEQQLQLQQHQQLQQQQQQLHQQPELQQYQEHVNETIQQSLLNESYSGNQSNVIPETQLMDIPETQFTEIQYIYIPETQSQSFTNNNVNDTADVRDDGEQLSITFNEYDNTGNDININRSPVDNLNSSIQLSPLILPSTINSESFSNLNNNNNNSNNGNSSSSNSSSRSSSSRGMNPQDATTVRKQKGRKPNSTKKPIDDRIVQTYDASKLAAVQLLLELSKEQNRPQNIMLGSSTSSSSSTSLTGTTTTTALSTFSESNRMSVLNIHIPSDDAQDDSLMADAEVAAANSSVIQYAANPNNSLSSSVVAAPTDSSAVAATLTGAMATSETVTSQVETQSETPASIPMLAFTRKRIFTPDGGIISDSEDSNLNRPSNVESKINNRTTDMRTTRSPVTDVVPNTIITSGMPSVTLNVSNTSTSNESNNRNHNNNNTSNLSRMVLRRSTIDGGIKSNKAKKISSKKRNTTIDCSNNNNNNNVKGNKNHQRMPKNKKRLVCGDDSDENSENNLTLAQLIAKKRNTKMDLRSTPPSSSATKTTESSVNVLSPMTLTVTAKAEVLQLTETSIKIIKTYSSKVSSETNKTKITIPNPNNNKTYYGESSKKIQSTLINNQINDEDESTEDSDDLPIAKLLTKNRNAKMNIPSPSVPSSSSATETIATMNRNDVNSSAPSKTDKRKSNKKSGKKSSPTTEKPASILSKSNRRTSKRSKTVHFDNKIEPTRIKRSINFSGSLNDVSNLHLPQINDLVQFTATETADPSTIPPTTISINTSTIDSAITTSTIDSTTASITDSTIPPTTASIKTSIIASTITTSTIDSTTASITDSTIPLTTISINTSTTASTITTSTIDSTNTLTNHSILTTPTVTTTTSTSTTIIPCTTTSTTVSTITTSTIPSTTVSITDSTTTSTSTTIIPSTTTSTTVSTTTSIIPSITGSITDSITPPTTASTITTSTIPSTTTSITDSTIPPTTASINISTTASTITTSTIDSTTTSTTPSILTTPTVSITTSTSTTIIPSTTTSTTVSITPSITAPITDSITPSTTASTTTLTTTSTTTLTTSSIIPAILPSTTTSIIPLTITSTTTTPTARLITRPRTRSTTRQTTCLTTCPTTCSTTRPTTRSTTRSTAPLTTPSNNEIVMESVSSTATKSMAVIQSPPPPLPPTLVDQNEPSADISGEINKETNASFVPQEMAADDEEMNDVSVPSAVAGDAIPSTVAEVEVPPTVAEAEVPSTVAEVEIPSTIAIDEVPSTVAEVEVPPTVAETEVPSTVAEVEIPSTVAEDAVPSTVAGDQVPSTGTVNIEVENEITRLLMNFSSNGAVDAAAAAPPPPALSNHSTQREENTQKLTGESVTAASSVTNANVRTVNVTKQTNINKVSTEQSLNESENENDTNSNSEESESEEEEEDQHDHFSSDFSDAASDDDEIQFGSDTEETAEEEATGAAAAAAKENYTPGKRIKRKLTIREKMRIELDTVKDMEIKRTLEMENERARDITKNCKPSTSRPAMNMVDEESSDEYDDNPTASSRRKRNPTEFITPTTRSSLLFTNNSQLNIHTSPGYLRSRRQTISAKKSTRMHSPTIDESSPQQPSSINGRRLSYQPPSFSQRLNFETVESEAEEDDGIDRYRLPVFNFQQFNLPEEPDEMNKPIIDDTFLSLLRLGSERFKTVLYSITLEDICKRFNAERCLTCPLETEAVETTENIIENPLIPSAQNTEQPVFAQPSIPKPKGVKQSVKPSANTKDGYKQTNPPTSTDDDFGSTASESDGEWHPISLHRNTLRRRMKPAICFTQIDCNQYSSILAATGCIVVDEVEDCDILVAKSFKRVVKMFQAISKGIPILSERWLDDCILWKQLISPNTKYILSDKPKEQHYNFNLRKSLVKALTAPLKTISLFITPSVIPEPTVIIAFMKCAGVHCMLTIDDKPRPGDKLFLCTSKEDRKLWTLYKLKYNDIIILNTEGIMQLILQQEYNDEVKKFTLNLDTTIEKKKKKIQEVKEK